MNTEAGVYRRLTPGGPEVVCVPDAISFSESKSPAVRFLIMVSAVVVGVAGASLLDSSVASADALKWMFLALTLAGGFLSTWSPCGYSSLSCCVLPVVTRSVRSCAGRRPSSRTRLVTRSAR